MEVFCKIGKIVEKKASELAKVLMKPIGSETPDYVVYDVCRGENRKTLSNGELQYDLTRIHPGTINTELHKTAGHYHSEGYPELFEVLEGELITILEDDGTEESASKAYAVKAKAGETVIIPPNFGFCSINASTESDLIMSNWIDTRARNLYENVEKNHGLCYYIVNTETEKISPIKNPAYKSAPDIIWLKPKKLPEELANLEFLTLPSKYKEILTIEQIYDRI